MVEVVARRSVQVGTVVERVHLVDPDALPAGCVRLDGVEHRDRLAVGEGHDEVVAVRDVVEDVLRSAGAVAVTAASTSPVCSHLSGS